MIRFFTICLCILSLSTLKAQHSINQYRYVIVPEAYSFLNSNDEYQLNTMTKFLFTKYGFETFIRGEQLPEEILNDGCKALRAKVHKKSSMFTTRLHIELVNCNEETVFASKEGISNAKEYKRAYQDALRNAFDSFKTLKYAYQEPKVKLSEPSKVEVATIQNTSGITPRNQKGFESSSAKSEDTLCYLWKDKKITLYKKEYGYLLQQHTADGESILGKLYALSRSNHYLMVAGTTSGSAYFDTQGHLKFERVDPATDTILTEYLKKQ